MLGTSPYIKAYFLRSRHCSYFLIVLMPYSARIKKDAELVLGIKITSTTISFNGVRMAWRRVLTRDDSERKVFNNENL